MRPSATRGVVMRPIAIHVTRGVVRCSLLLHTSHVRQRHPPQEVKYPDPKKTTESDKFYEHVMRESQVISDILADDQDMYPLTDTQQADYDDTTTCGECGEDFTKSNHKVRHHDHVTGQYLFPACNNCKLTLKMPNR